MVTIGLFPNIKKQSVATVLNWMITYLCDRGIPVLLPEEIAQKTGHARLGRSWEELRREITIGITLGGDGTILHVARQVASAGIPLCGVNMGQLGFLTEVELSDISSALEKILQQDYLVEDRLMLDAVIIQDGVEKYIGSALNDVVITKNVISRMLRLKLYVNSEFTANYSADGLIISTSTGSTGYSLSAGGPIISPNLRVVVVTPICPHSLHSRSLVVSEKESIKIDHATQDAILTIDGQVSFNLLPDDEVVIKSSAFSAKLVKLGERSYYETLRKKLWRGDTDADL